MGINYFVTCEIRARTRPAGAQYFGAFANSPRYHKSVLKYSIVVPFHNEEDNVTTLYDRVKLVMEQVGDPFEMVFVDDGSRDRTYRLRGDVLRVADIGRAGGTMVNEGLARWTYEESTGATQTGYGIAGCRR